MTDQTTEITSRAKDLEISEPMVSVPTPFPSASTSLTEVAVQKWSYEQLLGQKQLNRVIKVETGSRGILFDYTHNLNNLQRLISGMAGPKLLSLFRTRKWRVNFTLTVESAWQHVGLMAIYSHCLPSILRMHYNRPIFSLNDILQLNHQFVRFGHSGTYKISTSWNLPISSQISYESSIADWIKTASQDIDGGGIVVQMIVPLTVAAGVMDVPYINIWHDIEFEDLSMYRPADSILNG